MLQKDHSVTMTLNPMLVVFKVQQLGKVTGQLPVIAAGDLAICAMSGLFRLSDFHSSSFIDQVGSTHVYTSTIIAGGSSHIAVVEPVKRRNEAHAPP